MSICWLMNVRILYNAHYMNHEIDAPTKMIVFISILIMFTRSSFVRLALFLLTFQTFPQCRIFQWKFWLPMISWTFLLYWFIESIIWFWLIVVVFCLHCSASLFFHFIFCFFLGTVVVNANERQRKKKRYGEGGGVSNKERI